MELVTGLYDEFNSASLGVQLLNVVKPQSVGWECLASTYTSPARSLVLSFPNLTPNTPPWVNCWNNLGSG